MISILKILKLLLILSLLMMLAYSRNFRNETGFISIAKWYTILSKLDKRLNCQLEFPETYH